MRSHFFVKLISPRPTFPQDITPEEKAVMLEHAAYWTALMDQGKVHVFGPVLDPEGAYGIGVLCAENEEEVRELMAHDPARTIALTARIAPMTAILPAHN